MATLKLETNGNQHISVNAAVFEKHPGHLHVPHTFVPQLLQ